MFQPHCKVLREWLTLALRLYSQPVRRFGIRTLSP